MGPDKVTYATCVTDNFTCPQLFQSKPCTSFAKQISSPEWIALARDKPDSCVISLRIGPDFRNNCFIEEFHS